MNDYTITLNLTAKAEDHEQAADFGWTLAQELRKAFPDAIGPIVEIKTQEHKQ